MDYKKKLFWWDFLRFIILLPFYYIPFLKEVFPINIFTEEVLQLSYFELQKLVVRFGIGLGIRESLSNSGHIWGDFTYLITGNINVWAPICLFTIPIIIVLDYLWAYRNKAWSGKIRTANWFITMLAYFVWTVFFTLDQRYDYYVWLFLVDYFHWKLWVIFLAIYALSMMWIKLIVSGYFIYKEYSLADKRWAPWVLAVLSLGVPGTGQIAKGEVKKGIVFLLLSPFILIVSLFLYHIPALIWWLYAAYDAKRISR